MAKPVRLVGPGEKGIPLLHVALRNAGLRAGTRAIGMLTAWDYAERELGHELGAGEGVTAAVQEYSRYWKQAERTAWNELRAFRAAFPSEESPARLASLLRERQEQARKRGDVAGLLVAV